MPDVRKLSYYRLADRHTDIQPYIYTHTCATEIIYNAASRVVKMQDMKLENNVSWREMTELCMCTTLNT